MNHGRDCVCQGCRAKGSSETRMLRCGGRSAESLDVQREGADRGYPGLLVRPRPGQKVGCSQERRK